MKKIILLVTVLFPFLALSQAQVMPTDSIMKTWGRVEAPDVWPEYPGEFIGMYKFIERKIKRPKNYPKGRVYTSFIVNENGQVTNARVLWGINSECDKAALDVVTKMKFKPAIDEGKIAAWEVRLPIEFK